MDNRILECLSGGKRLSTNTISKRTGIHRNFVAKQCFGDGRVRRVDPLEVGWGAHPDRSRVWTLVGELDSTHTALDC